ncbi:MAG: factor-independent urate hydroxylase, partial [Aeoliella sp.]
EVVRQRIEIAGEPHQHAFVACPERNNCTVVAERDGIAVRSGIEGLEVLKTTGSGFSSFHTCENTSLQPSNDRILATSIEASWPCDDVAADWYSAREDIRGALVDVFANTFSPSVQATLYEMGRRALDTCSLIDEIDISLPNQHHLLVNLSPFGLENPNEVFVPVSEPFGNISATITREESPA